jgi:hypothetical protein
LQKYKTITSKTVIFMKKRISFFTVMLMSILCMGIMACKEQQLDTSIMPDPACIPIFIKTTLDDEAILLADNKISENDGVSREEQKAIRRDYVLQYGEENIRVFGGVPLDEYVIEDELKTAANCYEMTFEVEFSGSFVPSAKTIEGYYGFIVKFEDRIAVCKRFVWSYLEDSVSERVKHLESLLISRHGATIIGTTTIRNLGTEVHDIPITF